jgi:hypothetical protein
VVQVVVVAGDADAVCTCLDGLDSDNWYRIAA